MIPGDLEMCVGRIGLSMRAFAAVESSFAAEAAKVFGFLASEFNMAGPEFQRVVLPVVSFVGRGVRYRIMLDPEDKAVMTRVWADLDAAVLVAELDNLVQAAGLGARNYVTRGAPTLNSLRRALESQARYVRLLQPCMTPENVVKLLRTAKAQEWKRR